MQSKIFKTYKDAAENAGIRRNTKQSIEWFRTTIRQGQRKINNLDTVTNGIKKQRMVPGSMVTYSYIAKTKDKLPFWDMHPLIIMLKPTADGWYGANLHYLPPILRAELLSDLNVKKTNLSQIVAKLESSPLTAPCLKRYLAKQLVSKPVVIPKADWEIAISLPFESFQGANNKKVWSNSRSKT